MYVTQHAPRAHRVRPSAPGRRDHVDDDLHRGADEHRGGAVGLLGRPMVLGDLVVVRGDRRDQPASRPCLLDQGVCPGQRLAAAPQVYRRGQPRDPRSQGRGQSSRSPLDGRAAAAAQRRADSQRLPHRRPAVWNPSSDTWEALVAQLSDIQPAGDHASRRWWSTRSGAIRQSTVKRYC
jgi:hypothetical protein